jgi:hypothetical protein
MNERIKELAIQAGGIWQGGYVEQANGDSVYVDKKFVSGGDMDVEQFARLLVNECYNRAEGQYHHSGDEWDKGVMAVMDSIEELFRS